MNALQHETSPYLLQHASNPVQWYPWGEEALTLAKKQNKPILLSIGYSACHWCHVMAYESFEDEETAALMNALFINIKVDREERPDLDKVYQLAHQLITEHAGGWPLTLFLTPNEHIPFYGGTYFPKTATINFKMILKHVSDCFYENQKDIAALVIELKKTLLTLAQSPSAEINPVLNAAPLSLANEQLKESFDYVYGGFGQAPKFPHTMQLEYLLRVYHQTREPELLDRLYLSLNAMAQNGLYDQLGGGFFRYATDAKWMIPHFEKMLYDNALLLVLYTHANTLQSSATYRAIIEGTADWMIHTLQSPGGGFYSTLNADSEGSEGRYYLWDRSEIQAFLSAAEYAVVEAHFGLDQPANCEEHWHLTQHTPSDDPLLIGAKQKLLALRHKRIPPSRDEKILTAWNALAIKALALAGAGLGRADYIAAAEAALQALQTYAFDGTDLYVGYKDNVRKYRAYLDDYAYLLDAILTLLQVRFRQTDMDFAIQLADHLIAHFFDQEHGAFFFTAHEQETLIQRPKTFHDEATPAGNAIACSSLIRLSCLTGQARYLEIAEKTLKTAWPSITISPSAHCDFLMALEEYLTALTLHDKR